MEGTFYIENYNRYKFQREYGAQFIKLYNKVTAIQRAYDKDKI